MLPPADDLPAATSPASLGQAPEAASVPQPAPVAKFRLYWWVTLVVIAADQLTKAIVRAMLAPYESVTVIPGLIDLTHVLNTGVAFGLLNELDLPFKNVVTTVLATMALGGIAYYARHVRLEERLARLGLSLILGGAVGNLADRLMAGRVIDFVDIYWQGWHFWAFNVADASISIGAVLVFVELLLVNRQHAPHSV
ncbi:MAG TPA: signal peptidase II [Vicinamibacterales bacterium]|nr:signal peptidase II [Vicinamibacterales bacterium]